MPSTLTREAVAAGILLPATVIVAALIIETGDADTIYLSAFTSLLGLLAGLLYWHAYRGLGSAPFAFTASLLLCVAAESTGHLREPVAVAALLLGIAFTRLALALNALASGSRPLGWVLLGWAIFTTATVQFMTIVPPPVKPQASLLAVIVALGIVSLFAWLLLVRPAIELGLEPIVWLLYRIRGVGPGLNAFPMRGPCLVVANHACWFDPLFLAKVLPRPITPMMTSRFYDRPLLKWLVKHVFHAIRVHERALKQDVPDEIRKAIAALDRGECVVIFPEGLMRRTEEKLLKRFGRGVWQILAARPGTPVFACWIEGGWGSFCSYFNGKPMLGKRVDIRRPIGVAVSELVALDAATQAEHLRTRFALMNRVLESQALLGLPGVPPFVLPKEEGAEEA